MANKLKIFILLFFLCNFCFAQKFYIRNYIEHENSTCEYFERGKKYDVITRYISQENFITRSGRYQTKSASFAAGALSSFLIGGTFVAIELKKNPHQPVIAKTIGGIAGTACLVCIGWSIHYQLKAGRELKLNGASLEYKF